MREEGARAAIERAGERLDCLARVGVGGGEAGGVGVVDEAGGEGGGEEGEEESCGCGEEVDSVEEGCARVWLLLIRGEWGKGMVAYGGNESDGQVNGSRDNDNSGWNEDP